MCGKRSCMARITRTSTEPSPTPASNTRTAGGRGWMCTSSSETRCATSHFSLQVLTNSRYFCRLSKKRKLRCGSSGCSAAAGTVVAAAGRGAWARSITAVRAAAPCSKAGFDCINPWIRSSVSVVMRPPLRSRAASLPSLTARRPKVDSASPVWRQYSEISCRSCWAFMMGEPGANLAPKVSSDETRVFLFLRGSVTSNEPRGRAGVNHKIAHSGSGQINGQFPTLMWDAKEAEPKRAIVAVLRDKFLGRDHAHVYLCCDHAGHCGFVSAVHRDRFRTSGQHG